MVLEDAAVQTHVHEDKTLMIETRGALDTIKCQPSDLKYIQ